MRSQTRVSRFVKLAASSALAVLLLAGGAQAQTTYRWVGQDGRVHYSDQPPPPAVKDVQLRQLKSANVVETGGAYAYETRQAARNSPLTLYTSEKCTDYCRMARDFLARRGAPYSEKILRTAADEAEYRKATGNEKLTLPVLTTGKKVESGFEESAWNRLLDGAGYPAQGSARSPSITPEAKTKAETPDAAPKP